MARKNEFVRMSWWDAAPHLTMHDIAILQSELRRLYPTIVFFPKSYHFHELGNEPRRPEFINDMVDHFTPSLKPDGRYWFKQAIAARVPWPEDIATGNPQRLIGRPHRNPYQDSKAAFRRFGRTVYFRPDASESFMLLNSTTIELPRHSIAYFFNAPTKILPAFRVLSSLGNFNVQLPHDTEDPEVASFQKTVSSILNKLTVRKYCLYDGISGEPIIANSCTPISKHFFQRCALEPNLHLDFEGYYKDRPCLSGPTPAQRWKWRREAKLPSEPRPAPLQTPKILPHEMAKWWRENIRPIPIALRIEINKLSNRAMFEQIEAQTPGFKRPANFVIPTILPETDIWSKPFFAKASIAK